MKYRRSRKRRPLDELAHGPGRPLDKLAYGPGRLLPKLLLLLIALFILHTWLGTERIVVTPPDTAPAAADTQPWNLTLVNQWYGLPDGVRLTLKQVRGVPVDGRIAGPLKDMLNDAEDAGYCLWLNAGYRTTTEQQTLFEEKAAAFRQSGYDDATARALAQQWVALPGTSEHELGIAVDIGTDNTALYDWLAANSWRYGFIQRYPPDKTALTGVSHEPWHYRYVGESAASEMHAQGLCLEEYVQTLAE